MIKKRLLLSLTCSFIGLQAIPAETQNDLAMWFARPADGYGWKSPLQSWTVESPNYTDKGNPDAAWEKYGLPLGNGFIGAMLYGGTARERVQLNEHSLWSGGPGTEKWMGDYNQSDAHEHLAEIRELLLKGDKGSKNKAQSLSAEHLRGLNAEGEQPGDTFGRYQTFGEMFIETGHPEDSRTMDYRRQLDLSTGLHSVRYTHEGCTYTRTSFCSNPDRVLALNFAANKPGRQNLKLQLHSPHIVEPKAQNGMLVVAGKLADNGLQIEARIGILKKGGTVSLKDGRIEISKADEVTFLVVLGTDYAQTHPHYRGKHPAARNTKTLSAAMKKGFEQLKTRHVADYQNLHGRVSLDVGSTPAEVRALPLDERLKRNRETADHDLEELYFQFGRYLLMSCSRPGGLPANLQGIWCNEMVPSWHSDYHFNINLQMNYWPSGRWSARSR